MRPYHEIFDLASARHGEEKVREHLGDQAMAVNSDLAAIPDDRWLSQATKCIFQAGFNWKVVEAKWQGFEEAFEGFDLGRWVLSNDDDISMLASDTRIIRNPQKIKSVPYNARFFAEISKEAGGVGAWIAGWKPTEHHLLLEEIHKRGSRMGSMTGQYFLRFMRVNSYICSRDVTAALIAAGVIDKAPTSKKAKAAVQNAFNQWMDESGRNLIEISRTLAMSIDG